MFGGDRTVRDYIAARVVHEDRGHGTPCWIWQREIDYKGYGRGYQATVGRFKAHRGSYEAFVGPIPAGLTIDHLCCVRSCVNPQHLEAVTAAENVRRAARARTHCKHGHEYTPENTRITPKGHRHCRTCYPHPAAQRTATRCRNGHVYGYDEAPGSRTTTGGRCKVCRRANHARHNLVKLARRAAARRTRGEEALVEQRPGIARHIAHDGQAGTP